jgi:hypothetical protein
VLDADRLARLDRIAVCGRCRKKFSLAERIRQATDAPAPAEPKLNERDVRAAIASQRKRDKAKRAKAMRERAKLLEIQRGRELRDRAKRERFKPRDGDRESSSRGEAKQAPARRAAPPPKPPPLPPPLPAKPASERISRPPISMPRRSSVPPTTPVPGRRQRTTPSLDPHVELSPTSNRRQRTTPAFEPELDEAPTSDRGRRSTPPLDLTAPASRPEPHKRRWRDSVPKMVAVESPPELSVRDSEPGAAPEAEVAKKVTPIPGPGRTEPSERARRPFKKRTTSPGIGGLTPTHPPVSSAPPPSSVPPPPESDPGLATPIPAEPAISEPPATSMPPGDEHPPEVSVLAEPPSLPPDETHPAVISEPPEDDEDDDYEDSFDEDGGDRPTLLLPDEGMLAQLAEKGGVGGDGDGAEGDAPMRNAAARIVMSRNDWIKLADPGLRSLVRDEGETVRALVTLLTPRRPSTD